MLRPSFLIYKTTTWLIRGASAIVIIFGVDYFAKPQITKLTNYILEKKENKNVYKNAEWYKKYLRNPESYCEKLIKKSKCNVKSLFSVGK